MVSFVVGIKRTFFMSEEVGRQLPRARPVVMTFYDILLTQPYTAKFYIQNDATEEDCQRLIKAVDALSQCVLGKYKIGHQEYVVPDYPKKLENISPYAMGTFKWQISYHTRNESSRRHTIPGHNPEYSVLHGKAPNPNHPLWIEFLELFREMCVSKEGEPIESPVDLGYTTSRFPPKSAKKRRKKRRV
jgi:hypothetical protein